MYHQQIILEIYIKRLNLLMLHKIPNDDNDDNDDGDDNDDDNDDCIVMFNYK
jgi:hypothetical protein